MIIFKRNWLLKGTIALFLNFSVPLFASDFDLIGNWKCYFSENISDTLVGENSYSLKYQKGSSIAVQEGKVTISNIKTNLFSSMDYEVNYEYVQHGSIFRNTLKNLTFNIKTDQLNILEHGAANIFPKEGDTIKVVVSILPNGDIKSTHENGKSTQCSKV
jgi:hypothetical protein